MTEQQQKAAGKPQKAKRKKKHDTKTFPFTYLGVKMCVPFDVLTDIDFLSAMEEADAGQENPILLMRLVRIISGKKYDQVLAAIREHRQAGGLTEAAEFIQKFFEALRVYDPKARS